LPPTLVGHVGEYVIENQLVSVPDLDRRFRQRSQQVKLWLGMVEAEGINHEADCVPEVFFCFLWEARDQGNRRLDPVLVIGLDSPNGFGEIQSFVDYLLHAGGSGLDTEEDASTSRLCH